jgi:(methylthio)acryloyl-CoA hydratase
MNLTENLLFEQRGAVAVLTLDRPAKRNALNTATVQGLGRFFSEPPEGIRSAVITSSNDNFSAGLDLAELQATSVFEGLMHSQSWRRPFNDIQFGTLPVVSVLRGAVIGAGLELAVSTHIRVAEPSAYYALPEGSRGIFVGGGGSVRIPRLIGVDRMADMMLTGRVLDAETGMRLGISQYLVDAGAGFTKALELAERIAENSQVTNYAVLQALPRIAEMTPDQGLFTESLMAAISSGSDEAKERLDAFLAGKSTKVSKASNTPNTSNNPNTANNGAK